MHQKTRDMERGSWEIDVLASFRERSHRLSPRSSEPLRCIRAVSCCCIGIVALALRNMKQCSSRNEELESVPKLNIQMEYHAFTIDSRLPSLRDRLRECLR